MKKVTLLVFALLLFSLAHAQDDFQVTTDPHTRTKIVQYYNVASGVILRKSTAAGQQAVYTLGLTITRQSVSSDDFMSDGGMVMFEDKTYITFQEPTAIIYMIQGKQQVTLKHVLSDCELAQLRTKRIDYIVVGPYKKEVEKFKKETLQEAFTRIDLK